MSNFLLKTFTTGQVLAHNFRETTRERISEERGAETIQVIMIMGIMAVVVLAVMTAVSGGITNLTHTVQGCIDKMTGQNSDYSCKFGSQSAPTPGSGTLPTP